MKYRIINATLLLNEGEEFVAKKDELYINGSKIEAVGSQNAVGSDGYEAVDAKGKLVMPGLINSHTHVYMNFMKNSADDYSFNDWLFGRILPVEARMEKADFYWSTLFGCIEMIKTGTTACLDMHIQDEECAKAAMNSGMRFFTGRCLTGNDLYGDASELFGKAVNEKEKYENDLIKFVLSPHSIYLCSEKMLSQVNEEAKKRNMIKHIHLSESEKEINDCLNKNGKTPVEYLRDIGFLDDKTVAAHCVQVSGKDIEILKECGVSVATNPSSNAKLGNGIAPIKEMLGKGVNVCLGTDSAASNNTLNMFREMGVFSLIHKAANKSAQDFSAHQVLKCATLNPAAALGMQGQIGVIEKGAYADLVFVDLDSTSMFPNNNAVSAMCSSANGSEVDSVMVNGKFVMKNRELTAIDVERVWFEVSRIADKYL